MTGPVLADGGRAFSVGQQPVQLTEFAPVTVINTSTVSRVWLSSSSNVSTGTGVPLEPGTSYDWSTAGQLWAILDPAATSNAQIIITGSGGDWSPSPVAVGTSVALALLASGVPVVATTDLLYLTPNLPPGIVGGFTTATLSTAKYQSLRLTAYLSGSAGSGSPPTPWAQSIYVSWLDNVTNAVVAIDEIQTVPLPSGAGQTIVIPVKGERCTIQLHCLTTDTFTNAIVAVYGSTRPADRIRITQATPGLTVNPSGSTFLLPVAAAGTSRVFIPPVEGGIAWRIVIPATASSTVTIGIGAVFQDGVLSDQVFSTSTTSAALVLNQNVYTPLHAQFLSINQTGASAFNAQYVASKIPV